MIPLQKSFPRVIMESNKERVDLMFYTIEKIAENTYRFDENDRANCYLVVGQEKALLIDGCYGIGDLMQTIRDITDKPVIAAATHRHPDHTCGLRQIGDYYASELDDTPISRKMDNRLIGMMMVLAEKQKIRPYHNRKTGRVLPLQDGDVFDLGGRTIEVRAVPGHTAGSVIFLDHQQKLMFSGDDANPSLWMHGAGATTLQQWQQGAQLILDYLQQGYTSWMGHRNGRQSYEQVSETYRLVQEIIDKTRSGQLTKKDSPYPHKGAMPQVRFKPDRVL